MIRVWNYNKSRIHSYRGARYVEMALDEQCIFKGEIRRATGTIQGRDPEQNSECILFTIDETTLQVCAMHPSARSLRHARARARRARARAPRARAPQSPEPGRTRPLSPGD